MKTLTLTMILCLLTVAAFGQASPKVKELQPFVGTLQCTGIAFASPYGPEHPTKSTVTGAWVLGGTWLEIHYTETKTAKSPHPYAVRAFFGYDEQPKAFVSNSVDDMGGYGTSQSPGWDGDKLVFTGPMHGGGATMNGRDTFTKTKDGINHLGEMEDKGTWTKLDQETCKRAK